LLLSGEGMFGKVYTAVNMDTGAYMAMKEVSVDHLLNMVQTSRPQGANLWAQFQILTISGDLFLHFCKISRLSEQCVTSVWWKTNFGPLSKRNIGRLPCL